MGLLSHLVSATAPTPAANSAQPCLRRAENPTPLRSWKAALGEGANFSTALRTQPTQTPKSARTFSKCTLSSLLRFFFSCVSVFCCWLDLAVEVLNNKSRSSPAADSDLRACAHQISRSAPDFGTQKQFRYLSKPNFLRVNYP